jgi:hypothetical protein
MTLLPKAAAVKGFSHYSFSGLRIVHEFYNETSFIYIHSVHLALSRDEMKSSFGFQNLGNQMKLRYTSLGRFRVEGMRFHGTGQIGTLIRSGTRYCRVLVQIPSHRMK